MKSFYNFAAIVVILAAFSPLSKGQCISTFPYTQDFEGLTNLQVTSSCLTNIPGDTVGGWTQSQTDAGEWRADSAGTHTKGTGPGATRSTSGEGIGTDYDPGTTSGKYYYVGQDSLTSCYLKEVSLLSPCFDLSDSTYYRLQFAYNMFGRGMGTLHIDVLDSNVWVNDVYYIRGEKGSNWRLDTVDLTPFHRSNTQIRFRFTVGYSMRSDCAIDAIRIEEFTPELYDAEIVDMWYTPLDYLLVPKKHAQDILIHAYLKNNGTKTITNIVSEHPTFPVPGTSLYNQFNFKLGPGETRADSFNKRLDPNSLRPLSTDGTTVGVAIEIAEKETLLTNNRFILKTNLSDTIYARDDSTYTAGLGYNAGTGQVGTMYELMDDDTLTTVSFFLDEPVPDSTRVHLYEFTKAPGQIISSSNYVRYNSDAAWYTVSFSCPQILKKGMYFVAVEQRAAGKRIELACAREKNFVENTNFYGTGTTWTEFKQGNNLIYTPLIRMNFGSIENKGPKLSIQNLKDTICQGDVLSLKGAGTGVQGFAWSPAPAFSNPTSQFTAFESDTSVNIILKGWNQCRIPSYLEKRVTVKRSPSGSPSPDTTICLGDQAHLRIQTNNSYTWTNGPTNSDYFPTPIGDRIYTVSVDSSNGCSRKYSISVNTSTPDLKMIPDTVTCEATDIVLYATGGVTYEWDNGVKTANNKVAPVSSRYHYVTGTNAMGCAGTDSVYVLVDPAPQTTVSHDTAVCFGERITLRVNGGVSNSWVNGPSSKEWNFRPVATKDYIALSSGQDGCIKKDTVHVVVAPIPSVKVREDTAICEGTSITLEAMTSDDVSFDWRGEGTTRTITVSPKENMRYRVTVANSVGCSSSDSVMIYVDPLPVAGFELTQDGAKVTLINKSMNGSSYNWEFGDGNSTTQTSVVHTYLANGDYTIKLTTSNDCGTDDTSVIVTVELGGSGEYVDLNALRIWPNPTDQGYFTLSLESDYNGQVELLLADMSGRELKHKLVQKNTVYFETDINVKGISEGIYLLKVNAGNGTKVIPVVVR